MNYDFWVPVLLANVPTLCVCCVGFGIIINKVNQLEHRMKGNGVSIPGQCHVHTQQLNEHDRRLAGLERANHQSDGA